MARLLLRAFSALAVLLFAGLCHAHPLGLSSINRYAGLRLHAEEIELDWLIDFAEMPAWAEIETLDADHDGAVNSEERARYVEGLDARMRPSLALTLGGVPLALRRVQHGMEAPPGQNGLSTLRVAIEYRATIPAGAGARLALRLRDTWLSDRGGWRELAAEDTPWGRVVSSTLPQAPRAGRGLVYPVDDGRGARVAPPRQDDATFVIERLDGHGATSSGVTPRNVPRGAESEGRRLIALLRAPHRSWGFVLFALALAFGLGAGHALSPGHGKMLVGAWLVGSRGNARHALLLGGIVTVTHTASVFVMAALALVIERYVGSEKLLRMLELASGAFVAALALSQLPERVRRMRARNEQKQDDKHDHDHEDVHEDQNVPEHVYGYERGAEHAHRGRADYTIEHDHEHGHSHVPPEEVSLRALVALGVSGGMVPCPGALVVLLAAIGLRQTAFGVALLVAFSLGLAAVLSGVGLLFVLARDRFERISTGGWIFRALPVLSSCAVFVLGVVIIAKALIP